MMTNIGLPMRLFGRSLICHAFLAVLIGVALAPRAYANVYATNVRLNGATTNLVMRQGSVSPVSIQYLLNEPASAGVSVDIVAGSNIVRTLQVLAGEPGTLRGTNAVAWDGLDSGSNAVAAGTYAVRVTARAVGYIGWTQLTSDTNTWNYVWQGGGIGVVKDPASPWFGRVFVGNAAPGPSFKPGDQVGVLKLNADASPAEEGGFTTGGQNWAGDGFSPWHIEVSQDGYVYINDWRQTGRGEVYRWDLTLSAGSKQAVLRPDNYGSGTVDLTGPALIGSGAQAALWMADIAGGLGLLRYNLDTNGVCATNDPGVGVVGIGGDLNVAPYDVAVDQQGNVYTVQNRMNLGDSAPRVLCFPPYDPATNNGAPLLTASWAIGGGDNTLGQALGIAVDPTGTYVAVACQGVQPLFSFPTNGCTQIFYATNGARVVNLDLGIGPEGDATHQDSDCTWDAAGNVYYIDAWQSYWRSVSPPGSNQFTTVALQSVQILPLSRPVITFLETTNGVVTLDFSADPGDVAYNFVIMGSQFVTGPYSLIYSAVVTRTGPGAFRAVFPAGLAQFYRVARAQSLPPQPPLITSAVYSGGVMTLHFLALPSDAAEAFTVIGAPTVGGSYAPVANTTNVLLSPGVFKTSFQPAGPPPFFYRLRR